MKRLFLVFILQAGLSQGIERGYVVGERKVLFLRVEFSDKEFTGGFLDELGSLTERFCKYFSEISDGKVTITTTVSNVYYLGTESSYYGKGRESELIEDAKETASINFSEYDHIMVLHPGCGEETSGDSEDIRSTTIGDSVIPAKEMRCSPLGIWCHELLHQDPFNLKEIRAGFWSIMGMGWRKRELSTLDAPSKWFLGWIEPVQVSSVVIPPNSDKYYRLGGTVERPDQFFMIERRGEGFLVWHYQGDKSHIESITLLQADGKCDLENSVNYGDDGDPFPGSTRNSLIDDNTIPNLRYKDGTPSGFRIYFSIPRLHYKCFPNPIRLNKEKRVFFDEIPRGASVVIYNIAGERVKELRDTQNVGRVYWDVDLSSGVYIFVVRDQKRNVAYGKIGVIR